MDAIAAIFIHQLTEARHRGAFEMAHMGFSKLCHALWSSPVATRSKMPKTWVEDLLESLQSSSIAQLLTVTRRSAGLPFFVQVRCIFTHACFEPRAKDCVFCCCFMRNRFLNEDVQFTAIGFPGISRLVRIVHSSGPSL